MNVLIWVPPWLAQGDPLFYRNAFAKHLLAQARLLAGVGHGVTVFVPELFAEFLEKETLTGLNVELITMADQLAIVGRLSDPSVELYAGTDPALVQRMAAALSKRLPRSVDVVLLWETPVPFLEVLYPEALIIHQMPGAFSRPPYPHTVVFDPGGLYREGILTRELSAILEKPLDEQDAALVSKFRSTITRAFANIRPFSRAELDPQGKFTALHLLPLQVTEHYAFLADSGYRSQAEFLLDVLATTAPEVGVVTTQYITPRVRDTVLTPEVRASLERTWPNFVHLQRFDSLPTVSQYLLSEVDAVVTCSSSLGLQGLLWELPLHVRGNTFLRPFDGLALSSSERDRILGFLLQEYCVLADAVTTDATYLNALLEEMLARKRSGKQGRELLPGFANIDAGYRERVLSGVNVDRAVRDVGKQHPLLQRDLAERSKFRKQLDREGLECVTFDVFDTLLRRVTETPADLYRVLEDQALQMTGGVVLDFARVRAGSEVQARQSSSRGEITLRDIYALVRETYGLDEAATERLMQAEIELECSFVRARPNGLRSFTEVRDRGLPIHLVSDMYLPRTVIERMLRSAGIQGYERLFLSNEYGVRKKEGGLFDVVLAHVPYKAEAILHVGDHKEADVQRAESRGMRSYRVPRAVDHLRANLLYRELFSPSEGAGQGQRGRSLIVGTLAAGIFDTAGYPQTSFTDGSPYVLGYAALGPLVLGLASWILREARRDGVTDLYFLAREGEILRKAYQLLAGPQDPKAHYLLCSRRASRVAALQAPGDVAAEAAQPFAGAATVRGLLESRFGVTWDDNVAAVVHRAGLEPDQALGGEAEARVRWLALCTKLADSILATAAVERETYLAYLASSGLAAAPRPGVVDLGWRGNMQGALGRLVGRPLVGYYYATLDGADRWFDAGHRLRGYVGEGLGIGHPDALVRHRQVSEYLLCSSDRSLKKMRRVGARLEPEFVPDPTMSLRLPLIREVHRGVEQFVRDASDGWGVRTESVQIDPFLAARVYKAFLERPAKEDASLLVGHVFEDKMGGVPTRYLVAPGARAGGGSSIWGAGFRSFHSGKADAAAAPPKAAVGGRSLPLPAQLAVSELPPRMVLQVERFLVERIAGERKLRKYERDRDQFFGDSQSRWAQAWLKMTAKG